MRVLIAGGGISGLTLALSCHQAGIPFQVFEASAQMRPLGVGINVQPNAVRELYALGLADQLGQIGLPTQDYGFYSGKGLHIWTEPRGLHQGYRWPQYSVHRGKLLMLLYQEVIRRCGPDAVRLGWRVTGFENAQDAAVLHLRDSCGNVCAERGAVVVGADGIHSAVRAQIVPDEGPPSWGGAVLWRGTTRAVPFLSGASMVLVGHGTLRFVGYPISTVDPATGMAEINWICERVFDPSVSFRKADYSRQADIADFLPAFESYRFDWLDVPALVRGAKAIYEYPMVDRDPLSRWTYGAVTLMGDAAHAMYPVGSNGAGAGILDARKLTAAFLRHGLTPDALQAFEDEMRPETSKMVMMNRSEGPDQILNVVEQRSGGAFDHISDVIPKAQMDAHFERYKIAAGQSVQQVNTRPDIIPEGACFQTV